MTRSLDTLPLDASGALAPTVWADLVGKPFAHAGRGPDAYDCYGLVLEVSQRLSIMIPDATSQHDATLLAQAITANLASFWRPCPIVAGTLLAFRRNGLAAHVGLAIDHNRFLHAAEEWGQVRVDQLSGSPLALVYRRNLIGAYAYAG